MSVPVTERLASQMVNGLLAVGPFAALAKQQARNMMIKRAEAIGVPWRERVAALSRRDWDADLGAVADAALVYPEYYLRPFHAYAQGNLCWEAALEVEVAAYAVHARIWPDGGAEGDARLRASFLGELLPQLPTPPGDILDIGCSVGMSTAMLRKAFPQARLTGLDLSPHFLAVARHRLAGEPIRWHHAAAETSGLPDGSFDLVCAFLLFHELPQPATRAILAEARRLLRPGGHFAMMDMNPASPIYARMPLYIFTLLKSTEPYLDDYFGLDFATALAEAGFSHTTIRPNTPRHRTIVASIPLR